MRLVALQMKQTCQSKCDLLFINGRLEIIEIGIWEIGTPCIILMYVPPPPELLEAMILKIINVYYGHTVHLDR